MINLTQFVKEFDIISLKEWQTQDTMGHIWKVSLMFNSVQTQDFFVSTMEMKQPTTKEIMQMLIFISCSIDLGVINGFDKYIFDLHKNFKSVLGKEIYDNLMDENIMPPPEFFLTPNLPEHNDEGFDDTPPEFGDLGYEEEG